jgi:polyisoprenyl-phosphate glycosyltransferase
MSVIRDAAAPARVTVLVPCLNEEANIGDLILEVRQALAGSGATPEFLFVDDGSTDGTLDVLRRTAASDGQVSFLALSRNFGHQAALSAGLDHADGDAVIMMDADLQHPPGLLAEMVRLWRSGCMAVNTLRVDGEARSGKAASSKAFYRLFRLVGDVELQPGSADFRLLDRELVRHLRRLPEKARFYRGLVPWLGFRQVYLPYSPRDRRSGKTKYSVRRMIRLALDGLIAFSEVPLVFSFVAGAGVVAVTVLYSLWIVYAHFFTQRTLTGWSSLMLAILGLGGLVLMSVGLVSLYVARVYQEVKGRPVYLLRESSLPPAQGDDGGVSPKR